MESRDYFANTNHINNTDEELLFDRSLIARFKLILQKAIQTTLQKRSELDPKDARYESNFNMLTKIILTYAAFLHGNSLKDFSRLINDVASINDKQLIIIFLNSHPEFILAIARDAVNEKIGRTGFKVTINSAEDIDNCRELSFWQDHCNLIKAIIKSKKLVSNFIIAYKLFLKVLSNIEYTLKNDEKYNNNLLSDVKDYLLSNVLIPTRINRLIDNLFCAHGTTQIDIAIHLGVFNEARNSPKPARPTKAKIKTNHESEITRKNIPLEIILHFAARCGYRFDVKALHQVNDLIAQQLQGMMNTPLHKTLLHHDANNGELHLFNPKDNELRAFALQFLKAFRNENGNLVPKAKDKSLVAFIKIFIPDINKDVILITMSKHLSESKKILDQISAFIRSRHQTLKTHLEAESHLTLINPSKYVGHTAIPLLADYINMTSQTVADINNCRVYNNSLLHEINQTDHFKECAEMYFCGFICCLLRRFDTVSIKSVCNVTFDTTEYKPLCTHCERKAFDYLSQIIVAHYCADHITKPGESALNASFEEDTEINEIISGYKKHKHDSQSNDETNDGNPESIATTEFNVNSNNNEKPESKHRRNL